VPTRDSDYPPWLTRARDRYDYDNGPDEPEPPEFDWHGHEFWEWPGPD
jgi:hypothetical protein